MVITPYFVFVHVPKTGGTWLRNVIPEEWRVEELGTHRRHCLVPPEHAHLPVLAFVRNPWDWYVSFWDDRLRHRADPVDGWIDELLRPEDGFDRFVREALHSRDFKLRVGRWMRDHDLDLYTATVRDITAPAKDVWFGRFESLREDTLRFLDEVAPMDERLRAAIVGAPPQNVGRHRDYRDHYSPELRDLVAERCRPIIRKFGYDF